VKFEREDEIILFEPDTKMSLHPITCVNFNEDFYATPEALDSSSLALKIKMKKAVVDVLILI
jgi:hypothetical protein